MSQDFLGFSILLGLYSRERTEQRTYKVLHCFSPATLGRSPKRIVHCTGVVHRTATVLHSHSDFHEELWHEETERRMGTARGRQRDSEQPPSCHGNCI